MGALLNSSAVAVTAMLVGSYSPLLTILLFSVLAYFLAIKVIPTVSDSFKKAGLVGKDLLKADQPVM